MASSAVDACTVNHPALALEDTEPANALPTATTEKKAPVPLNVNVMNGSHSDGKNDSEAGVESADSTTAEAMTKGTQSEAGSKSTSGGASNGEGVSVAAEPAAPAVKPGGFELWRGRLSSARMVVAPMVDQSEPAWRMLSRKYGAELCYTPMFHANVFKKDVKYRRECLTTYPEDRPLIVQFCANDPEKLLFAARHCEGKFDALDINLGCPQSIAKRGHYGAFLQDEWDLISRLVSTVHTQTRIPVTCKIRVFEDPEKTVRYAQMLEAAGCQLLTVHGRTREMKGPLTGLADWDIIKTVRESVGIPVFANGNIQYLRDVHRCLEATGVQGVMTAEGNLHNPALFTGEHPPVWRVASEYLRLARQYPCPLSYARGHVFKMLHYSLLLPCNQDARQLVARANRLDELEAAVALLRERYQKYTQDDAPAWTPQPGEEVASRLPLPPFLCQPHEREPIQDHLKKMEANQERQRKEREQAQTADVPPGDAPEAKRPRREDGTVLSKRQQKKMAKGMKTGVNRVLMERCGVCCNPRGQKCEYLLCRLHCRHKCFEEGLDCSGHRILCKTKRQRAKEYWAGRNGDDAKGVSGTGTRDSQDGGTTENGTGSAETGQEITGGDGDGSGVCESVEGRVAREEKEEALGDPDVRISASVAAEDSPAKPGDVKARGGGGTSQCDKSGSGTCSTETVS